MSKRTTIVLHISALPARVFEVFERSLLSVLLRGGGMSQDRENKPFCADQEFTLRHLRRRRIVEARCRILKRDPPNCLAWKIQEPSQSLTAEVRLREGADEQMGSTVAECSFELVLKSRLRQAMMHLLGHAIDRRLRQQVDVLKVIAESGAGLPPDFVERDGPWRRAQCRYRGLVEACAPGMHQAAARLVMENVSTHVAVLDLGAGTGAWLARLRDAGFSNFTAVELSVERFGLAGVVPRRLDLNSSFSQSFEEQFGLITALEVVEHLDNPRDFLKQVHRLLEDDGYALVTMPNFANWAGRLKFLLRGEHRYFEEGDYEQRHISPVTNLHMRLMFREIGFRLVASTTAGTFAGPLKRIILAPAALTFSTFFGPRVSGAVAVYLVMKDRPDRESLGADSDYNRRITQIWMPPHQAGDH